MFIDRFDFYIVKEAIKSVKEFSMGRGGHFGAAEVPDLIVEDLRTFFRDMRDSRS